MQWHKRAEALAYKATHPASRWFEPVATTPRHLFMPRWWQWDREDNSYGLRIGKENEALWLGRAYSDSSWVVRVGSHHADHAQPGDHPVGKPTSSSTLPSLVVGMLRHGMLAAGTDLLCVTGTGYGTALACKRLGAEHVTSIDVDQYLVERAQGTLDEIGLRPTMATCDITGPLPGEEDCYDRIVSTVSVPHVPASWLRALRPGGRLVTTITGTGLVVVADRSPDGGARGQVTWDRAGFMAVRHGDDYEPGPDVENLSTRDDGRHSHSEYAVVRVNDTWELMSAIGLEAPGVQHWYHAKPDGGVQAMMWAPDGSWARATGRDNAAAEVVQGGPQNLWDLLDSIRRRWVNNGGLPVYGATVEIAPDGTTTFSRGDWSAVRKPAA